tara:strand:- start:3008 stop:3925 length:918 start_codon:yes stop_codon:yes gene_type:complete
LELEELKMKNFYKSIIMFSLFLNSLISQINHPYPPLDLVSIPTAGTLPRGSFTIETLLMKNGGMVPKLLVGLTDNFSIGMSFGVQNFIGESKPIVNKETPEVQIKYRLFEESESQPAFLIGLDTQGFGPFIQRAEKIIRYDYIYDESNNLVLDESGSPLFEAIKEDKEISRYEQKAWGVYAVLSKNWDLFGNLGFHLGINRNTFETKDNDEDWNLFFGLDKEINRSFSFLAEYNAALNDGKEYTSIDQDMGINDIVVGKGKGFLNAGLRWNVAQNLLIEINFKDINLDNDDFVNREIKIMYSEIF